MSKLEALEFAIFIVISMLAVGGVGIYQYDKHF